MSSYSLTMAYQRWCRNSRQRVFRP